MSLARINREDFKYNDSYFFDVKINLDLDKDTPRRLKTPAMPINFAFLMPIKWDQKNLKDQESPTAHFDVMNRVATAVAADSEALLADLDPLGGSEISRDYYDSIAPLRRAPLPKISDAIAEQDINDPLPLHPLKLLYCALAHEETAIEDPLTQDIFDLIFDKIALAAFLPAILSKDVLPSKDKLQEQLEAGVGVDYLDTEILNAIRRNKPLHRPSSSDFTLTSEVINLPKEYWADLIAYTAGPDRDEPIRVLVPLDDLDDILTNHLESIFSDSSLLGVPEVKDSWEWIEVAIKSETAGYQGRRSDFGFFYPIIDAFFESERSRDLQLLKDPFKNTEPVLPHVDEIDNRGAVWDREATAITTEMRIAASRYKAAKERFDAPEGDNKPEPLDFEDYADELRRATRLWYDAKKRFDTLSQEVGEEGYDLTLKDEEVGAGYITVGKFYNLTQKVRKVRTTRRKRRRLWYAEVGRNIRHCRTTRVFGFKVKKRCWWEYRRRLVPTWRTWYETIVTHYQVDEPVKIDYDPISKYLKSPIRESVFSGDTSELRLADAKRYAADVMNLPADKVDALSINADGTIAGIKNEDKEVHIFRRQEGLYRDQNGILLDTLLTSIDPQRKNIDGVIPPFRKKLLILPVDERRVDGSYVTVGFKAVHNPVKGRGSNSAPQVYLVETYRASVGQLPGHWLGSFAHSVTLFPGEERTFKLVTEQRIETEQSRESSATQKTSTERRSNVRDQVKNTFEKENTSKKTSHWNASASGGGSFGVFSAKGSAGGGGSSTKTSRDLATNINDRVEEVMNGASSSNEVQFKTSTKIKETSTTSSEHTISFRNVNDGRSVNYKFFQIANSFYSELSVHDLKVVVQYMDEIIPGLDIVALREFDLGDLPDIFPELIEEERITIQRRISDYIKERHKDREIKFFDGTTEAVKFLRVDDVTGALLGIADNKIEYREWYVNSGAYFVETEVSAEHATDEYVNEARAAELEVTKADAKRVLAEAEAIRAGKLVLPDSVTHLEMSSDGLADDGS